jgi:ubiquinone/menaquinone biosynthesis C-methylase UbiE
MPDSTTTLPPDPATGRAERDPVRAITTGAQAGAAGDNMCSESEVTRHYANDKIAERILAALRAELGRDVSINPDTLAPMDHFHGGGLNSTQSLAERLAPQQRDDVLDIGSGIGGPARWIAAHFGCHVTGIDLTEEFCEAAEALNLACGLQDQVRIMQGSALALPLPDASFDRAYSQNVLMNIRDKRAFYTEAFRVLRPGGLFAVDQVGMGPNGPPDYPQPWASEAENSFLGSTEEIRAHAEAAGFAVLMLRDVTSESIEFNRALQERIRREGPPRLGLEVLVGSRFRELRRNSAQSLERGATAVIQLLLRRPD